MKALREFIIRLFLREKPKGVMTALPNKELVDINMAIVAEKLMRNGIDPRSLKNANQVENAIKMIEDRPAVQEGITSTESAKVFNIKGDELDPNKPIIGGTQPGKKIDTDTFIRLAERNPQLIKQKIANKKVETGAEIKTADEQDPLIGSLDEFHADFVKETGINIPKENLKQAYDVKKSYPFNTPIVDKNGKFIGQEATQKQYPESKKFKVREPDELNAEIKARLDKGNKEGIARIRARQKMLDDAIDNQSPGFSGDRKVDAELVAEDLAERMGLVYDDLPVKQRLKLYDQAYTGLSKQRFKNMKKPKDADDQESSYDDGPADFDPDADNETFATGGRAGFANGTGAPSIKYDFDRTTRTYGT